MTEHSPEDERDLDAAEYALGLLEQDELRAAEARYTQDAEFAVAVQRWRSRLAPILREIAEEDVPPDLWARIAARLPASAEPVAARGASWRYAAIGASALAAALALVLVLQPAQLPPAAPPVATVAAPATFAQLSDAAGKPHAVARYDAASARLHIRATDLPGTRGTPELWIIAEGGAPQSLGLISASGVATLPVAEGHRALLHSGATLAITREDAATAPHPAPTGAIVASGTIATI